MTGNNEVRILLADDDKICQQMFAHFFARVGWSYEISEDGKSALKATEKSSFDVIFTDYSMPGLNGLDLLRAVKSKNPSQVVVVISGEASLQNYVDLLREGAQDILPKPIDFDSVERAVRRALDQSLKRDGGNDLYNYVNQESSQISISTEGLANGRYPLRIAERLYRCGKIDLNTKLKIELAFHEALINSIGHGNLELCSAWKEEILDDGNDRYSLMKRERLADHKYASRKLQISVSYKKGSLEISLTDQGPGFEVCFPEEGENFSSAAYGRGLSILRAVMDSVTYQDGGRTVVLKKSV